MFRPLGFRGSMIIHEDVVASQDFEISDIKRRAKRQASRKSKRRLSDTTIKTLPSSVLPETGYATVYTALLGVLFSFNYINPRMADDAFNILISFSDEKQQRLDEQAVVFLEDFFHTLSPELNHLFLPHISGVPNLMEDYAHIYLDLPFIVDVTERVLRDSLTNAMTANEIKERLSAVHWLKRKIHQLRRETL